MTLRPRHVTATALLAATLVALLGAAPVHAPRQATRTSADHLVDRIVDGEPVTRLVGNVVIDRDSLTVEADSAAFYRDRERYDFFGRVRMTRGAGVLTCNEATYLAPDSTGTFRGDVRLVEGDAVATARRGRMTGDGETLWLIWDARLVSPDYVVWADTIARYDRGERGEAFGSVRIVEPAQNSVVTGEHAVFTRGGETAVVDRRPVLTSREEGGPPMHAEARLMRFLRAEERIVMIDSVAIRQGTQQAWADTAEIHGRERVVMWGSPRLDDGDGSTMTAERIEFLYAGGELVRVVLRGDARVQDDKPAALAARYRGLPGSNVLTGDTITVYLEHEEPQRSLVVGTARSIYVPLDADEEVAFNDVSGDSILLTFRDRKVRSVRVDGAMNGRYAFLRLAELGALADRATALMDSLDLSGLDSLRTALPDSLDLRDPRLLAAALADSTTRGLLGAAAALPDSTLTELLAAVLSADVRDTLPDGSRSWNFDAHRETVDYSGHTALFDLEHRRIRIEREGRLLYGTMDLKADRIRMNLDDRELYAAGDPVLVDGSEKIVGRDMGYDFQNKSGAVLEGATAMDDFFYVGDEITRFGDGTLKIHSGRMTSCDLERPHYHFWADKMKIRPGDKVAAKPIVLKVGNVPLFALPFYFKSLKTGRQSGILFPNFNFGWSKRTGRYIRDWGYYWATSDYTDFAFRGDYNEHRELTWRLTNQYIKRYSFDGDVSYSRRATLGDGEKVREWQFNWTHKQPALFDVYNFQSSVRMSSKTISRSDLLNDVGSVDRISGQQTSNVRLSRSWTSGLNASLSFKRDEYVNRADDDNATNGLLATQAFPQFALTFKSTPLLPSLRAGEHGSLLGNILRSTYLRHAYDFGTTAKSFETTNNTVNNARGSLSLDFKQQNISIFTVSTGVSAGQTWTRDVTTGTLYALEPAADPDADPNWVARSVREEVEDTRTSLSINSSLNTKLFGVFNTRVGPLRALRHTLRFGVNHRLSPTIAGKQQRSESFGLSLNNRLDAKYAPAGADTTGEFRKLDGVFDWSLSSSYTPDRDPDSRWSTVNSVLTLQPGRSRYLKITLNQTIDPYNLRVESTRTSYGLSFGGRLDTGGTAVAPPEAATSRAADAFAAAADTAVVELEGEEAAVVQDDPYADGFAGSSAFLDERDRGAGRDETENGRFIPWRVGSNFSYSKNHLTDVVSARVSLNASVTLTRNWKATWRGTYDLESGALSSQSWNLSRELHCWQMKFSRTLNGGNSEFGFIISLKSIPDLKVTRGRSDLVGGLGTASGGIF